MGGGNPKTVVKNYTEKDCYNNAVQRKKTADMGCGTDPDPSNAYCYRNNMNTYAKDTKHCQSFFKKK